MRPAILVGIALVGCGGPRIAQSPKSWSEHVTAADRHEAKAQDHERAAREASVSAGDPSSYRCGDTVLNDQSTSGTERVTTWVPCWNPDEEAAISHRRAADRERRAARADREQAVALARTELVQCVGVPEREREHSPLEHRSAIANVIPHRRSGQLRGVRIQLAPVHGLTAEYMRRAIACAQARHGVLGEGSYDPGDPTLMPDVEITVSERAGRVEVLVVTKSSTDAQIAIQRARELRPQSALR